MIARVNQTAKALDEVELTAETMTNDSTYRGTCPKCGGGASKERSFSISKDAKGSVFFQCWRATCQYRGKTQRSNPLGTPRQDESPRPRLFTHPVDKLSDNQILFYRQKFGMSPGSEISWCGAMDRWAYKVFGPDGQTRGYVLRAHHPKAGQLKSLNYVHLRDEPFIGWYTAPQPWVGGVVVVEDMDSARKVSINGISSVALNGCAIDYDRAYEIGRMSEGFVCLALDRGTMKQALEYRQRYETLWGNVEIWQLDQDLKYVPSQRIREAIFGGKTDFISHGKKDTISLSEQPGVV